MKQWIGLKSIWQKNNFKYKIFLQQFMKYMKGNPFYYYEQDIYKKPVSELDDIVDEMNSLEPLGTWRLGQGYGTVTIYNNILHKLICDLSPKIKPRFGSGFAGPIKILKLDSKGYSILSDKKDGDEQDLQELCDEKKTGFYNHLPIKRWHVNRKENAKDSIFGESARYRVEMYLDIQEEL